MPTTEAELDAYYARRDEYSIVQDQNIMLNSPLYQRLQRWERWPLPKDWAWRFTWWAIGKGYY